MENTLENKAKFFAQYWGVESVRYDEYTKPMAVDFVDFIDLKESIFLELKPISSITESEVNNIATFYMHSAYNAKLKEDQVHFDFLHGDMRSSGAIYILSDYSLDFLRSRGYALPWMELSVEKLVEYGWIKLKEN